MNKAKDGCVFYRWTIIYIALFVTAILGFHVYDLIVSVQ